MQTWGALLEPARVVAGANSSASGAPAERRRRGGSVQALGGATLLPVVCLPNIVYKVYQHTSIGAGTPVAPQGRNRSRFCPAFANLPLDRGHQGELPQWAQHAGWLGLHGLEGGSL